MSNISNLEKYKRAKYLVKELNSALDIISKAYSDLKPYQIFNPVVNALNALGESRTIIQIHLKKEQKILDNKGKE